MTLPHVTRNVASSMCRFWPRTSLVTRDPYSLFRREILPALEAQRAAPGGDVLCRQRAAARRSGARGGRDAAAVHGEGPGPPGGRAAAVASGMEARVGSGRGLRRVSSDELVYFRQRLLEHQQSRLVFDALLQGLEGQGLIQRRGKQRLDSTHILGLVAQHEPPGEDPGDGAAVPGDARTGRAAGGGARGSGLAGAVSG